MFSINLVRLAGGAHEYEGRVEILHEGSWGTVCDDLWDLDDAKVVCKQLGFDGAATVLPLARFGEGSGDIFLDGVQCNGTETSLIDCKHEGIGVHNCGHKEDAGVSCMRAAHQGKITIVHSTNHNMLTKAGVSTWCSHLLCNIIVKRQKTFMNRPCCQTIRSVKKNAHSLARNKEKCLEFF